jgi:sec-independent protein translocase protein TatA
MGGMSIWHWIVVVVVVLLLFGRGKISELMGDMAQGIKAFKKGMTEDEKTSAAEPGKTEPVKTIDHQPDAKVSSDLKARAEAEKRFEGSTS